jgi:hypothetical protein
MPPTSQYRREQGGRKGVFFLADFSGQAGAGTWTSPYRGVIMIIIEIIEAFPSNFFRIIQT